MTEESTGGPATVDDPRRRVAAPLTLAIQPMINDYHLKHGLRHNDYFRYRGYCTRRIKHIRKVLHFTQTSHKPGSGGGFHPKPVKPDLITDPRMLELVVLTCERAWAHAMQLKDESELQPRRRFHVKRKLGVAVQNAHHLLALCSGGGGGEGDQEQPGCTVDARTVLEAKAYKSLMEATFWHETRDFTSAMAAFNSATAIYRKICASLEDTHHHAPYLAQIAHIEPLVNFCAYSLGEQPSQGGSPAASEISSLEIELEEKLKLSAAASDSTPATEVTWLNSRVSVRLPWVAQFLTTLATVGAEMRKAVADDAKMSLLDGLLDQTRQVQAKLKEELKCATARSGKEDSQEASTLLLLLSYVSFVKLSNQIQKNLLFVMNLVGGGAEMLFSERKAATSAKPQTVLKFFESCIELLDEILALDGVQEAIGGVINCRKLALSVCRDFHLARCFQQQQEWKSALALLVHCKKRAPTIDQKSLELPKGTTGDEYIEENIVLSLVQQLSNHIEQEITLAYTSAVAAQYSSAVAQPADTEAVGAEVPSVPLDCNLDTWINFGSGPLNKMRLTEFPPAMKPIPAKPLFFDIAGSNHIALPEGAVKRGSPQQKGAAAGGGGVLGGYFSGWWGGGAKK